MNAQFEEAYEAIVAGDLSKVKKALVGNRGLATMLFEKDRFEERLIHWFYRGDTLLHAAAAGYLAEIAQQMMNAGADPQSARNRRRAQPLHYAADGHPDSPVWNEQHQVATIRVLLRAGAMIDAREQNGATPLHRAVRTRCAAAVNCLLEAGADACILNNSGSTPFHLAVQDTGRGGSGGKQSRTAQATIIKLFLRHGMGPSLRNEAGKTVWESAKSEWILAALKGNPD